MPLNMERDEEKSVSPPERSFRFCGRDVFPSVIYGMERMGATKYSPFTEVVYNLVIKSNISGFD